MSSPIIDLVYLFAVILGAPWLVFRMVTTGKYRRGLARRLGAVRPRRSSAPCLWVHGVSVGEVLAARTLVTQFRQRHPAWDVVVSTTTSTGQDVARRTYPDCRVVYYPVDFTFSVEAVFRAVRPSCIVLVEADLWPNFLSAASRRGVPVVVVNSRITARSFRRQMALRYMSRRCFYDTLAHVTAQTETHARRLSALGVSDERVTVVGSLKYDAAPRCVENARKLADELGIGPEQAVLVAGSTFEPEEEILLRVYERLRSRFDRLRLVLVPRHPARFDRVARVIEQAGFTPVRRSQCGQGVKRPLSGDSVILGDSMGELTRFYGLASFVFVGKTLVDGGGQNILEPAALGKTVVFGPSVYNFQETAERLLAGKAAVQVRDEAELESALADLLENPARVGKIGNRACKVIDKGRGATARNLDIVDKMLAQTGLI